MKLFDKFEAVKFPEEDLIFITHDRFLYYIYDSKYKHWRKYRNAGNNSITIKNYPDISEKEFLIATGGVFPTKKTDLLRLIPASQLRIDDMLSLLEEDYPTYLSDHAIQRSLLKFLRESDLCTASYLKCRELLDHAVVVRQDNGHVLGRIKDLSFSVIGRDIYKKEIGIVDGHDSSSYFWIMPARIIDYEDTDNMENVAEMRSNEISIEEGDVDQYLTPFLYKYFDVGSEANKNRIEGYYSDADGNEIIEYVKGFEWYLTRNYFSFDAMIHILQDMRDTIDALSSGKDTEYTSKLRVKRGIATYQLIYANDLTKEQISEYNANRPAEDDTETELIIDFFNRFIYRMEYMMRVGKEKGYNLISFMGP